MSDDVEGPGAGGWVPSRFGGGHIRLTRGRTVAVALDCGQWWVYGATVVPLVAAGLAAGLVAAKLAAEAALWAVTAEALARQ